MITVKQRCIIAWWIACLFVGFSPIIVGTSGCKSPQTTQAVVFNTFKTSWTVSKTAYDAWCERVVLGKVTTPREAQVDAAWNKYRLVFKTSFNLATANWSAPTPASLLAAQDELINVIRAFSK